MGSDYYKVKVLHYINPHLIWVLVEKEEKERKIIFEQIGMYGILPQNITFEQDCVVKEERCTQWMQAAVFVMKNWLLDAEEVWFSPTYLDKKVSIFDDNTHKYGELTILLKSGETVNLLEAILQSRFAVYDECLFHEALRDNNLNTKLNYVTTQDVVKKIKESYITRDIPKTLWVTALNKQTSVLQEAQQLKNTITSRNLGVQDRDYVDILLKNKLNDLKLCKDVDEESEGRASCMRRSRAASFFSVSIRKKLDLLKIVKGDTTDSGPGLTPAAKINDIDNNKPVTIEEIDKSPNIYNDANNNMYSKKDRKPKKPNNTSKSAANLVGFGPPGLDVRKFSLKPAQLLEEEHAKKEEYKPQKTATEDEEPKENQEQDVYSKTDSEVNIEITNLPILQKINTKNALIDTSIVNKRERVNAKAEKLSAMQRKIRYLEEKINKINDNMSSASDIDSSKLDVDSDAESITALEIKLQNYCKSKKPVDNEPVTLKDVNTHVDLKTHVNPFKNVDGTVSIFVDKLVSPILMVHTKKHNRIQPLSSLRDIPFNKDIHVTLKNMAMTKPMRPQTISWPTILRGHSLFLIGPYDSGKTMGYLPAVSRLVNDYKNSPEYSYGPSCIIVCATSLSVAAVESACNMFLHSAKIFACYPGIDDITITTSLLNGCDLLICTPTLLVRFIQEDFCVDLRNLSTFVIDDCEHISNVYSNELKFCLIKVRDIVKSRANKEWKIQYVVISRIWCDFMSSLARKAPDSVVCISAFEECVLYSKASTSVEFTMKENKIDSILAFLKDTDRSRKTVIVCRSDDEVQIVEKALTKLSFVVFSCNSSMTVQDLYNLDKTLRDYEEPVTGPTLVCCDGNLTHLNVTDAHYLVHYSLPTLFSMFCKRFAVLNDNYPSIFKTENCKIKIKILLDDTNIEQLPKILNFVKRCTNEVPPVLDEISLSVLSEKDLKKAENLVPICNNLLTLGKCPDYWNCTDRHAVFKDYDNPKAWVPREGTITFQILHYHTAVNYSARITSCITKSSTTKYPQAYSVLSIKMGMYYSKEVNRKLHGVPKVGDICAVSLKQSIFARCQVRKILKLTDRGHPHVVLIKLIDEEVYETTRDILLYHLPDDLKNIETHVVKIVLANLMPQDRDVTFSKLAKYRLKKIADVNEDVYFRGQVILVVGNYIFVDTVEVCQNLTSLEEVVVKYDFKKELLDGHASPNPDHLDTLKKLCKITSNEIRDVKEEELCVDIPKPIKILPKGRWAHLESDTFSSVFFMSAENPCKFFVRLVKFEKCLMTLIKDIKKYVSENPEPLNDINKGDIVLAEFPDDGVYERARIDEIIDNKVLCFFVDQADLRRISSKKLFPITEYFITLLPFQAIECKLIGVQPVGEEWTDFSTNFLADNSYDAVDKLKYLYTKYFTKEKAEYTEGHKYGVVLIDTYSDENVTVNQMMIDKNLAEGNEEIEYLNDIQFTRVSSVTSDLDLDEEENPTQIESDSSDNRKQLENILSNNLLRSVPLVELDNSFDNFDFVTDTSGKIGTVPISEVVAIKEIPETESKEIMEVSSVNYIRSPVENVLIKPDAVQLSKPRLLWLQDKNTVTIKIQLIVDEYDLTIKERYLKFSTNANDTKYGFEFELYGVVNVSKSSHSNKGQYILVKLWKVLATNWRSLTSSGAVNKWIVYDVDSIDVSSDESDDEMLDDKKNFVNTLEDSDSDDSLQDDISFTYKRE